MKSQQEMLPTFDRVSTREELHQVLDLLTKYPWATGDSHDGGGFIAAGVPDPVGHGQSVDEETAEKTQALSDMDLWSDLLPDAPEHVN